MNGLLIAQMEKSHLVTLGLTWNQANRIVARGTCDDVIRALESEMPNPSQLQQVIDSFRQAAIANGLTTFGAIDLRLADSTTIGCLEAAQGGHRAYVLTEDGRPVVFERHEWEEWL